MVNILEQSLLLRKLYFEKSEVAKVLLLSCAFSLAILFVRVVYTRDSMFLFLAWNLFLAYLPYALSTWMEQQPALIQKQSLFCCVFMVWLLVLPNSF